MYISELFITDKVIKDTDGTIWFETFNEICSLLQEGNFWEEKGWDPWKELGIKKDASDADIKKAHRKAVMKFHPDRNPNIDPQKMQRINAAIEEVKKYKADPKAYKEHVKNRKTQGKQRSRHQARYKNGPRNAKIALAAGGLAVAGGIASTVSGLYKYNKAKRAGREKFKQQQEKLNKRAKKAA